MSARYLLGKRKVSLLDEIVWKALLFVYSMSLDQIVSITDYGYGLWITD